MAEEPVSLSDKEARLVDEIVAQSGLTRDEVLTKLFKAALARRVKRKTGYRPAANVIKFRR